MALMDCSVGSGGGRPVSFCAYAQELNVELLPAGIKSQLLVYCCKTSQNYPILVNYLILVLSWV